MRERSGRRRRGRRPPGPAPRRAAHRAEVVKPMVAPSARGRGLGRRLLEAAERYAAEAGATLLLLDTETGSAADRLYASAGWTGYGVVPDHTAEPGGALRDCTFFYKRIG
ncbi:GNAT family N-acetyltransferase [Nocardiopsis sp. CNT-189]|uniref:GNAT family N-acetyltransferase n=1 Tax=Nocardiopsis oceanisediminis TaxID=2816862 RepID=UPI003B3B2F52